MQLKDAQRIVIKVGSAMLTEAETAELRKEWLDSLTDDIAALIKRGHEVLIVTSGAVALGRRHLDAIGQQLKLEDKQAAFACGQVEVMLAWRESLIRHRLVPGQVLINRHETENRRRYLNVRNTIDAMLSYEIVPVVNENDVVSTRGLRFGDNDRLSARIAQMAEADVLVILSDIDGLYTSDPTLDPEAEFIPEVKKLTPEIMAMGGDSSTNVGSGGMATKLEAAEIAMGAGCHVVVMQGHDAHPLRRHEEGERCTWFLSHDNPKSAKKHWIASNLNPMGELIIDDGAVQALQQGKSLLPAGVTDLDGHFDRGDAVLVKDKAGKVIAKGLSAYPSAEAVLILGRQSGEIEEILGFQGRYELIHRDDLVLL